MKNNLAVLYKQLCLQFTNLLSSNLRYKIFRNNSNNLSISLYTLYSYIRRTSQASNFNFHFVLRPDRGHVTQEYRIIILNNTVLRSSNK